jgi:hypothetical protein
LAEQRRIGDCAADRHRKTTYVRNIYKYYVAYRLTLDAKEEAAKARLQVAPAKS